MCVCYVQVRTDQDVIGVFYSRHTGNTFLWNASKYLPEYTASRPTTQPLFTVTAAWNLGARRFTGIDINKRIISHIVSLATGDLFGHPCAMLASIHTRGRHAKLCNTAYLSQIAIISSAVHSCWWQFHLPFGVALCPNKGRARGAPLHVGFICSAVVVCIPQLKSVDFGELTLLRRVLEWICLGYPSSYPRTTYLPTYLNLYPLVHTCPMTNPAIRVSNYPPTYVPIHLYHLPISTTQTPTHTRYIQQVTKRAQFFRNNACGPICPKWQ